MKKILLSLIACAALEATPPQLELKLGYFYFGDHKFRKIYHQDALDTQIVATGPVWKWLRVYGGVNYISREGRTLGVHSRTEVMILPLSLGLQALIDVEHDVKYYFTIGPRYFYFHQTIHAKGLDHSLSNHAVGGFVNTGAQIYFGSSFFIDFFSEYSYSRAHFTSHKKNVSGQSRQIGGITVGGGIGYQF